jgi:hypothetical protein
MEPPLHYRVRPKSLRVLAPKNNQIVYRDK